MEGYNLDTLTVEIKGDNTGLKNSLKESEADTRRSAESLRVALGDAIDDVAKKQMSAGEELKNASNSAKMNGQSIANSLKDQVGTASNTVSKSIAGLGTSLGSLPFNAVSSGSQSMTSGIQSLSAALYAIPITAVISGLQSLVSSFIQGVQGIEQLDLKAKRLGLSVNELRGAMTWSGAAGSSVTQAIQNVNQKISQSNVGGINQGKDFQQLANISGSGQTAGNFTQVVSQLSAIRDETTRASLAFRLLGDSATDFLDVLGKPQGMQEAQSLVKRFGLDVSDADIANAKAVAQTVRELQMLWEGFKNQVILAVAPFARALSEAFDPKNVNLSWIKDSLFQIGRAVFGIAAFFIEASRDSNLFWEGMQAGITIAKSGFNQLKAVALQAVGEIAQAIIKLFNEVLAGSFKRLGQVEGREAGPLNQALQSLGRNLAKPFEIKANVRADFNEMASKARDLSSIQIKEAQKQILEIGVKVRDRDAGKFMDDLIKKAERFANETGKGIDNLSKTEREAKNMNTLFLRTMSQEFESMRSKVNIPGRGFIQDMEKLFTLQGLRNFTKDPNTGREIYKTLLRDVPRRPGETRPDFFEGKSGLEQSLAFQGFERLLQDVKLSVVPQLTAPAMFRSQEAVSAELKFMAASSRPEIQEQIRMALDLANQQRARQEDNGKKVLEALIKLRDEIRKSNSDF
jgi:hypothetical protein